MLFHEKVPGMHYGIQITFIPLLLMVPEILPASLLETGFLDHKSEAMYQTGEKPAKKVSRLPTQSLLITFDTINDASLMLILKFANEDLRQLRVSPVRSRAGRMENKFVCWFNWAILTAEESGDYIYITRGD